MPLARFVTLHAPDEKDAASVGRPLFAVVLACSPSGVVLVFNRFRQVWELPGGLIDPGESARTAAARELLEESGCQAGPLEWLGLVEVDDGRRQLGAVFRCRVASVPAMFQSEETGGIAIWTREDCPEPLGHADSVLLNRFG
jgi:8-oxo-dGTP diphosphatase